MSNMGAIVGIEMDVRRIVFSRLETRHGLSLVYSEFSAVTESVSAHSIETAFP